MLIKRTSLIFGMMPSGGILVDLCRHKVQCISNLAQKCIAFRFSTLSKRTGGNVFTNMLYPSHCNKRIVTNNYTFCCQPTNIHLLRSLPNMRDMALLRTRLVLRSKIPPTTVRDASSIHLRSKSSRPMLSDRSAPVP